jgi:hypothetical protein
MASFAKIGLNGKVIEVLSVNNNDLLDSNGVEQEINGIDFLTKLTGWAIWKQTSYNTKGGQHLTGGTPFRKNFAGVGYTYDEDKNAFIPPKPYPSWILNETTCCWGAPVVKPETFTQNLTDEDGNPVPDDYNWNEETQQWELVDNS